MFVLHIFFLFIRNLAADNVRNRRVLKLRRWVIFKGQWTLVNKLCSVETWKIFWTHWIFFLRNIYWKFKKLKLKGAFLKKMIFDSIHFSDLGLMSGQSILSLSPLDSFVLLSTFIFSTTPFKLEIVHVDLEKEMLGCMQIRWFYCNPIFIFSFSIGKAWLHLMLLSARLRVFWSFLFGNHFQLNF